MPVETSTLLTFLQLIVLTFTALIYIGQSVLRQNEADQMFSGIPTTQPAKILGVGAVCLALSGIGISINLLIKVAAQRIMILQFWLAGVPFLSPWHTPPLLLIFVTTALAYMLFGDNSTDGWWWIQTVATVLIWTYAAVSTALVYQDWIPMFAAGTFAIGVSLFFVALVRLTHLFVQDLERAE